MTQPAAPNGQQTEIARRLGRLQDELKRRKVDAMVVYDRQNTFYLTGFRSSLSYLFVTPRASVLLVDGRYIEAARAAVAHCEVRLMTEVRPSFEKWHKEFRPRTIGFEGSTAWNTVQQWMEIMAGGQWVECEELIRKQRLIKSPEEIRRIEQSARVNDQVYERALQAVRPGVTEIDLRNVIRAEADRLGAEGLSFPSIVASGAMSSRPHYEPQARPLEPGNLLLIDMGMLLEGYCSDMTRVVGVGKRPPARLAKAYETLLEVQEATLKAVKPGMACAELDRLAREGLQGYKLDKYFTHGLGHGVGLEIHEAPTLNSRSKDVLRPGMIITIEPGVYLPGLGGIRIEDLVVVTRSGYRVLSRSPKAFRLLPFTS